MATPAEVSGMHISVALAVVFPVTVYVPLQESLTALAVTFPPRITIVHVSLI
jgi:VIT1/CCC1 family predicted Fe2+/Mn2+ transporter